MKHLLSLFTIVFIFGHSCSSIDDKEIDIRLGGDYDCSILDQVIDVENIKMINILRPMGLTMDTTVIKPRIDSCYFGPRLISLGNEYIECRKLRSNPIIKNDSILWIYLDQQAKNTGDWMTNERVQDHWEHDNHPMLGKQATPFSAEDGFGNVIDFDPAKKGLRILHFGNLTCSGSQQALPVLEKLKVDFPDVEVIHVFRDKFKKYNELVLNDNDSLRVIIDFGRDTVTLHSNLYKMTDELQDEFKISAFSTSFLVDSSGVIISKSIGGLTRSIRKSLNNIFPKELKN